MKILYLLLLCKIFIFTIYAQQYKPVNPKTDHINYQGYLIRLIPAMGNTYGYEVVKENKVIIHQSYNPFTMAPTGLRRKEDVYKIARWQINTIKSDNEFALKQNALYKNSRTSPSGFGKHTASIINKQLPKKIATELKIDTQ